MSVLAATAGLVGVLMTYLGLLVIFGIRRKARDAETIRTLEALLADRADTADSWEFQYKELRDVALVHDAKGRMIRANKHERWAW